MDCVQWITLEDIVLFYLVLRVRNILCVVVSVQCIPTNSLGGVVGYSVTTYNAKTKQPVIGFDMV